MRCSDAVITVSEALKDDLVSRHPRAASAVVIANGVTRPTPAPPSVLADLGLQPGDGYFLVVGRLVPEKGVDVAVGAARDLLARGAVDVDLVIVGGGRREGSETERALVEQARPAGDRIRFLGIQDPTVVALLYDHARALVAPSYQEGQPLVVAEAMAASCCVVASDIDAHVELLGGTGRLFPAGDADALADTLTWVMENPDDAHALGRDAAERIARGRYSWDVAARETDQVLATR